MYFYNLPSKRKQGGRRKVGGREGRPAKRSEDLALGLSVFQNVFVQVSKCICTYCKMYLYKTKRSEDLTLGLSVFQKNLSKFLNVFLHIS